MVSADTYTNRVSWYTIGDRKNGSTAVMVWFFKDPSRAVYFLNSACFLSEIFSSQCLLLSVSHALLVVTRVVRGKKAHPVCLLYSSAAIVRERCPCRPPPRFNATDAVFPLYNQCISISPSLVGSTSIFGRIGVGKSSRISSMLLISPAILSRTLLGINGGFVPWENSYNLLNTICRLTRRHWRVEFNSWLDKIMSTLYCCSYP